jgi:hypothetical protein
MDRVAICSRAFDVRAFLRHLARIHFMSPRVLTALCSLLFAPVAVHAVILAQGDGTQNTSAPADDFGWSNIVIVQNGFGNAATGVYLGNGWILSAYHTVSDPSLTGFQFGPVFTTQGTFLVDPLSATRILNPDSSPADLSLFRLTSEPALPSLTIASAPPTNNLAVTMMGGTYGREPNLTQWDIAGNVWTEVASDGDAQGYKWSGGSSPRWGTNHIRSFGGGNTTISADDGFGITTVFRTRFDNNPNEAQAASGDSGGGVFWKVGGQWQLGGVMLFVDNADGQPNFTSVFGNDTYAANLSTYRDQIIAVVPEPSTVALAAFSGATFLLRRRRR